MFFRKIILLVSISIILGLTTIACQSEPPEPIIVVETLVVTREVQGEPITVVEIIEVTKEVETVVTVEVTPAALDSEEDEPVTLTWRVAIDPNSLDPHFADSYASIHNAASLFMGLTQLDTTTGEVMPYLASDWQVSDDGLEWTFNLRDDVAWVHYNPLTGETNQSVDEEGNPRFVTAHDVVYGAKRHIDPDTAAPYAYASNIILNAQEVNEGEDSEGNPTELTIDDVGVEALDEFTVKFTLKRPAGYFPALLAGMWIGHPLPQWTIEEWDGKWTEAGLIETNGPYALAEWIHGGNVTLVKNPLWIDADQVQIEVIEGVIIEEQSTGVALYETGELDLANISVSDVDRLKADPVISQEIVSMPRACTFFYGFTNTKPPVDDVRVRRALSAALDRQSLIDNVVLGGETPATSFGPPGVVGAPAPGTVGQGYDLELAQASLQEFLDEKGMTIDQFNEEYELIFGYNTNPQQAKLAEAIQKMWEGSLGIKVRLETLETRAYMANVANDSAIEEAFHIFRHGWCADYADENNMLHEVFNSEEGLNPLRRNCADPICSETTGPSEFDELTIQASSSDDPQERLELYTQAEDILSRVEVAYIPVYHNSSLLLVKPWLTYNNVLVGGYDFYNWKIDAEAKRTASGE